MTAFNPSARPHSENKNTSQSKELLTQYHIAVEAEYLPGVTQFVSIEACYDLVLAEKILAYVQRTVPQAQLFRFIPPIGTKDFDELEDSVKKYSAREKEILAAFNGERESDTTETSKHEKHNYETSGKYDSYFISMFVEIAPGMNSREFCVSENMYHPKLIWLSAKYLELKHGFKNMLIMAGFSFDEEVREAARKKALERKPIDDQMVSLLESMLGDELAQADSPS